MGASMESALRSKGLVFYMHTYWVAVAEAKLQPVSLVLI